MARIRDAARCGCPAQPDGSPVESTFEVPASTGRLLLACWVKTLPGFPEGGQAALKCLYLALMSLDPTGKGRKRWTQPVEGRPDRLRHHLMGRLSAGRK